jgi:hypothetical protein
MPAAKFKVLPPNRCGRWAPMTPDQPLLSCVFAEATGRRAPDNLNCASTPPGAGRKQPPPPGAAST